MHLCTLSKKKYTTYGYSLLTVTCYRNNTSNVTKTKVFLKLFKDRTVKISYLRFRAWYESGAASQLLHFLKAVRKILWSLFLHKKTVSAPCGHEWHYYHPLSRASVTFSLSYEVLDFMSMSITRGANCRHGGRGEIAVKGDLSKRTVPLTQQVSWLNFF